MTKKVKGYLFRSILEKNPRLLRTARNVQLSLSKLRMRYRGAKAAGQIRAAERIWIDPRSIELYLDEDGRQASQTGALPEDWDLASKPLQEWPLFHAIQAHYASGAAWEDTDFYRATCTEIAAGQTSWGCKSIEALHAKLKRLDDLHDELANRDIQEAGSASANDRRDQPVSLGEFDEVSVGIGRDGLVIATGGEARLVLAKLLGLQRIPAVVALRHPQWQIFQAELLDWANSREGKSYQPFTHPDLQHIPVQHNDGRFELMAAYLASQSPPLQGGRLLDIGAFFGYFCHCFEEIGFHCTAVENHPKHLYFMKKLHHAQRRRFEIIEQSIFDATDVLKYDVVLALSIFHHFLKTPASFEALRSLLGRLDTRILFFEPHCPTDYVMSNAHVNFTSDEFVAFILEHSCLNRAQKLGTVSRGRSLYVLEA